MHLRRERASLVTAISSMSTSGRREAARRFLEGLSADELQYIAAYFGARLLEPGPNGSAQSRDEMAHQIERYEGQRKTAQKSNGSSPESYNVSAPDDRAARVSERMQYEIKDGNGAGQRGLCLARCSSLPDLLIQAPSGQP